MIMNQKMDIYFENQYIEIQELFNLEDNISVSQNDQKFDLIPTSASRLFTSTQITAPSQIIQKIGTSKNQKSIKEAENTMKPEEKQKKKPFRETNPNSLKNVVAILRTWVNIRSKEQCPFLSQLWELFTSAKKINTKLLQMTFGIADASDAQIENLFDEQMLNKNFQAVNPFDVLRAQEIIRIEALQQLQIADVNYIIKNRRVKDKEEFQKYFYDFLKQISSGGMTRSSKRSSTRQDKYAK